MNTNRAPSTRNRERQPHALSWLLVLVLCIPVIAQDRAPVVLRSSTQLVVQTVSVLGKDGRPVEGLTAADFTVTEDGVAQEVSLVEFEQLDDTILTPQRAAVFVERSDAPASQVIGAAAPRTTRYDDRRLL